MPHLRPFCHLLFALILVAGLACASDLPASENVLDSSPAAFPGFACLRTVAETKARMFELAEMHPGFASVIDIGDSWEKSSLQPGGGEDLWVLKLTNAAVVGDKPKMFVLSSLNPNELAPSELSMRFAEWLLDQRERDPEVSWLLDHQEFHFLVHPNPDARKLVEAGQSRRKNTNGNYCSPTSDSRGADLNHNFPFKWGFNNHGTDACGSVYRGPSRASEPETSATFQYLQQLFPDRRGPGDLDPADPDTSGLLIDMHSYGHWLMWSWGWTAGSAPDGVQLEALGRRIAFHNRLEPKQLSARFLTDGTATDAAYGELGLPAFVFEIGNSYAPDCAYFDQDVTPLNIAALTFAARTARAPYRVAHGPDVRTLALSARLLVSGEAVTIEALADDARFSNALNGAQTAQAIAGVNAFVDIAPWQAGAQMIAMTAIDGGFDESSEAVSVTLDTTGMAPGRHRVWMQARDADGHFGPWAASEFQVLDAETTGTIAGVVRRVGDQTLIAGAEVRVDEYLTTTDANGEFSLRLPVGTHVLSISMDGYDRLTSSPIALAGGASVQSEIELEPLCEVLLQDAESGVGNWFPDVPWAITAEATSQTGSRAWTESPIGNYSNLTFADLASPTLDLTDYERPQLVFDSWCDTEAGWDFGFLEYTDRAAGVWQRLPWRCHGEPELKRVTLELPALENRGVARFRFLFESDSSTVSDGWYVDNIRLRAGGQRCRIAQFGVFRDGFEN